MEIIATIKTDFDSKFGIPRQSNLSDEFIGKIVFSKKYRNPDALRGLEDFSHIWLIWGFSENNKKSSVFPLVRPPRLGGNEKKGVFATRSPYRPNPIGLSSVKIESIELETKDGPVILVSGVDMMNDTPIYDIKPYLKYSDCHEDAVNGFAENHISYKLEVVFENNLEDKISKDKISALTNLLSLDPRPAYQSSKNRIYGFEFAGKNINFYVKNNIVFVCGINDVR